MDQRDAAPAMIIGSFASALVVLVLLGLLVPPLGGKAACIGEPIAVEFPYQSNMLGPHSCRPQCEDQRARYLLYTNGIATQCEPPPGCSDLGEDSAVTCRVSPPGTTQ
jgi:hypothetical protein